MIYTGNNAQGAQVYDVEARKRIDRVLEVDEDAGTVAVWLEPARLDHEGEVARETITFRTIYPIFGGRTDPVLFHCYGRIQ